MTSFWLIMSVVALILFFIIESEPPMSPAYKRLLGIKDKK